MKYEFTYDFLNKLIDKLEVYVNKNYNGNCDLSEWLDHQELATQGGWKVFSDLCEENDLDEFLKSEEDMNWEDFDDFVFAISKQLSWMYKRRSNAKKNI